MDVLQFLERHSNNSLLSKKVRVYVEALLLIYVNVTYIAYYNQASKKRLGLASAKRFVVWSLKSNLYLVRTWLLDCY